MSSLGADGGALAPRETFRVRGACFARGGLSEPLPERSLQIRNVSHRSMRGEVWQEGSMATIRDVAKRAGVAISTASAAINRSAPVSDAVIAKVEEAVRDIGYVPHA